MKISSQNNNFSIKNLFYCTINVLEWKLLNPAINFQILFKTFMTWNVKNETWTISYPAEKHKNRGILNRMIADDKLGRVHIDLSLFVQQFRIDCSVVLLAYARKHPFLSLSISLVGGDRTLEINFAREQPA